MPNTQPTPEALTLAEQLVAIIQTVPDHDTCVEALLDTAPLGAFFGTDHRGVSTWVSVGDYRCFISRTSSLRTVWRVGGIESAVQLAVAS